MESFPEYKHLELVQEFSDSLVYRAQHKENERAVLVKLFKKKYSQTLFDWISEAIKKGKRIDSYLIANPLRVFRVKGKFAISWEDTGAMFLSVILRHKMPDLPAFFELSSQIAKRLGELHTSQILHNDLRPQNIFLNEKTGEVRFTGLSFSKQQANSNPKRQSPETIGEDQFLYTSPEQTGRINWEIDQKSDLYSLGTIFYELLAGSAPFQDQEPQKRIQSHLVKEPDSLLVANPECPGMVDGIVLKLLSKGPEDRYQSAFGLQKDLELCSSQYSVSGVIDSFELGKNDNLERLLIPSKLYGSQENFVTLIESLNRVCTGSVEMMLVEGNAGMGKTTLISELLGLAAQKGAYIGRGKCEKEYRDTPYYALISAFQMLVRDILFEDAQRRITWKNKFLEALGKNGKLVVDFIPELELIIGEQPSVPKLDADESQNRLMHIFGRFIQTFTSEGNPLVIFLDGFHWADLASIQLIQAALSDLNSRYIMLIVAYQQHLVSRSHTFAISLDEIEQSGTPIQNINVTALNLMDVSQMIEDALSFKQDFKRLAQHILEITDGNPYFVQQYLSTLHERRLIRFDPKEGRWVWDIPTIKKEKIPKQVVALLAEKVKSLHADSIEVLKLASCIGNQFDLGTLVLCAKKDKKTILKLLEEPIEKGFVKRVDSQVMQSNRLVSQLQKSTQQTAILFQFSHSRVLLATYSLLKTKERRTIHLSLGRLLLESYSKDEIDQHSYQIVNQMNQGIQMIKKPAELYELARLNLIAGRMSQAIAAFETAWKYFSIGSELLPKESWEDDYELTKLLYLKRSQCEYFIGNTEAAEPIFDLLLQNIRTKREKVDVIDLKLNIYIKNNRLDEAIDIGLNALSSIFNEEIPPNNAEITIISQMKMQEIQQNLEQIKIDKLLFLPEMEDEDKKALMDLITNIIPAAYIARRNLWILLTLRMVELSLKHGNSNSSPYGYMNYAVILCSGLQDYGNGYAIGQLALDLNARFERVNLISQLNFLFGSYIGHWKNKAIENIKYLKRSYQAGIDFGDYISAALSVDFLMKTQIMVGIPLEEIQKEVKKHQDFVDQFNSPDLVDILEISRLMLLLKEPDSVDEGIKLQKVQSQELLESVQKSKNSQLQQWYYLVNAQIHYYFYSFEEALRLIQKSDELIASYSQLAISEHYFYYSLIILENYNNFSDEDKKKYWDVLKNNHQRLSNLAKGCPINFKDKEVLLSALMAGVSGNYIKAGDLFDEAIQLAIDNGFLQNEAIANELAAKYYLSKNKTTITTAYLRKACLAYVKWGAMAKIKHLEFSFPELLKQRQRLDDMPEFINAEETDNGTLFSELVSIVKASQEISREVVLEKIVEKLLTLILENTNSLRGYYLVEWENHFKVFVQADKNDPKKIQQVSVLLEEFESIAHSVVFYVIRTRKQIVLDDASKDSMFSYNKYIKDNKPKSILCLPILNHDKLHGILYLENATSVRAFPPKLVENLNLLISQVSISIENSLN